MAFKMKGSSLYGKLKLNRNMDDSSQPDGRAKSSAFQKDTDPVTQGGVTPTVTVSGGNKTERHADKFNRVKSTKGSDATKISKVASEYGGTWNKVNGVLRNQDGQTVKQAAIAQGQKKSKEKRDYVAENTTKKPGAPAIWPFKKKIKGTDTELVKEKKKKSKGKKIKTRDISKPSLSVRIFGSGKKKNKRDEQPSKKRNIPGFNS